MASIQGFELMPTLEEEEELITLATILRLRDHDLKEEELWSICQETCLALQSIEKTAPDLFHQLCLHPDTLGFNAAGGVSFLDRDGDIEGYLPPEHKKGIGTIEGHLFSIGKTLQGAARKPLSPKEDGNPKIGNNLLGLLDQMVAKEPVKRPLIGDIISKCSIFLKKDSSKVVCTKLTAWGRRRLSLESTQNYDVNHLKELSAIKEECSDLTNSTLADEKKQLNSQNEDCLKKQRRSLPKVPQKDFQKLKKLSEKVRKEHNTDAMERSTLTPPNLDAFENLSERAQEILRKIYDSSDRTNGGKEQALPRDESGDGANKSKTHTNVKSKTEKQTAIRPHLLKRNSVASVGTSLGPSLRFLRSQRDGDAETQAEKSKSMGAIKVASSASGKENGDGVIPVVNIDEGSPQMKRASSVSDIEDEAEALERYLKCRQKLYMNNERNKSPLTGEKSESSGEGGLKTRSAQWSSRKSASSPNLMGSVDVDSNSEDISELPEDFILDDLWSEESDVESTPVIKQKVRSHSIAAFSVVDTRSSAFRTPGQRKLSSSSKASRSSNDRASVLSNSSTDHESQSETIPIKLETENQTALNSVPPLVQNRKVVNGFRRHSLEVSSLAKDKQPEGKRRSTLADLRTTPSGYTSTATHFTPIIVAGENFVKGSDKLVTLGTDAKLKARMAFEAIKKAPRKDRPPKTMASDIEKDAESSKMLSVENPSDTNSNTSDCLVKEEPSKELQLSSDHKDTCIENTGSETRGDAPPAKVSEFKTSSACDVKVKAESARSISEKQSGKVLSLCEEQNNAISESRVEEKCDAVSLESSEMTSTYMPEKISLKSDDKEKQRGAEMDREIPDKSSEPKSLLVASVNALPSAILNDAKLQTVKVEVVAGSPLSERSLFSPIDKPEISQHEPVDSHHHSVISSSSEVNNFKNQSNSLECQDIKTGKETSARAQVNLNSEQPKIVPGGLFPPTSFPNSPLVVPQPVYASSHISPGLLSGGQPLAGTPVTGGAFAPGQFPFVTHPLNGNQGVANGDSSSPFSVNPMGHPLNPSQAAPGYQNFSMQVQFQQDPQTGLFCMIPLGVPAFPVNASPVLSSSPLYSPVNHLTSPQHHSSPLASVQTTTVPKKKTRSPGKSFDTSSDPDSGDFLRKRTPADKRRDPSRPSVDKSKLSSSSSTGKKSQSTRRSGTRLPSDSESSESSMFSPKPSGLKMDKVPVKPTRHKSKSLNSNNGEEKAKKLPKRNSADPAIGQRVDCTSRDLSGDSSYPSKLDKSSPSKPSSKGDAKVDLKSKDKSKHQSGTRVRSGAAVYGSPLTVSSPSRDSGVHMRYSMSSGEELSVASERQGQVSDSVSSNVMLKRVIRHIRHAFAFDGYLENGVEDLQMAEYITSLAHLSWSTFSSAITEKFCDLYWEEDLLERLYEEVNAKKVDKTAASKVQKPPVRSRHRARSPSKKPHSKRESSSSREQQVEKTKATQEGDKNVPQLSRSAKSSSSSSPRKVKRDSLDSQRSTASLTISLEGDINDLLPDEDNLVSPSSRNTHKDKKDSSPTRSKSDSKSERKLRSSETKFVEGVDKSTPKDVGKLKMDERSRKSVNQENGGEINTNPVKSRMKQKREINNNDLVKSGKEESIQQQSSNIVQTFSSGVTSYDASSKTSPVRDDGLSDHDRCREQNVRSLSLLSHQSSVDGSGQVSSQTDQLYGESFLDEVPKSPDIASIFSSPPPSSRLSQRSSPLHSGGSSEKRDASPLNTSLNLSESSFPLGLPCISRTESEIGSRSSTPSAQRIRQMLDSAITRSSSNASLNSTSSGNSSSQGLGRSSLSGVSSTRSLGDEVCKLQSGLMYGESVFDDEVIEYSRNLGGYENKGDEIEKKIKEVEQQISVEKKMLAKTEKFYRKLEENQSNKGADHKTMLTKVGHQLEEMETKLSFLDSVRCYLNLTYAEQWGLEHTLLYSFATSGKLMNLQPHGDNPMLQIKPIERGSCLQAGEPQGLFTYLYAKKAVMEGYLYQFLYTFRYFSKKQDLLSFIMEKFQAAEGLPIGLDECKKQISFRTVDIFHVWIEGFFEVDFRPDTDLMAEVISFISEKLVQVDQQGQALLQLIDLKDKSDGLAPVNGHHENSTTGSPLLSNLPGQGKSIQVPFTSRKGNKDRLSVGGIMACFSKKSQKSGGDSAYLPVVAMNKEGFSLSEHTSQTLAWQLTLIQQELFQKVHPVQYLDSRHKGVGVKSTLDATLNKPSQKYHDNGDYPSLFIETTADGGISQLLHYARNVSHWVAAEIVSCSSSKAQVALISKFVNIAKACHDKRNFATSIQILDGLNNLIVRQIPAWKNLPSKVVTIYEELEAAGVLLKGDSEFLVQGNQHKHLPTLPSTHLSLMHIQQLEIGGFKLANGMYKWPKLKAIGELVDQIRIFQQCRYTLEPDEQLQGLLQSRIDEFQSTDIQILAASNASNFHQLSSEKGSKKFQNALQKVKANLY